MNMKGCRLLHDFLSTQPLMFLATTDGFNLWSTNLNFLSDNNLNIYFINGNHTCNVNNILQNHKVALSVVEMNSDTLREKVSVRACGFCEILGKSKTEEILKKWNNKFKNNAKLAEGLEKSGASIFKIILTRMKYQNTDLVEKVIEFNF